MRGAKIQYKTLGAFLREGRTAQAMTLSEASTMLGMVSVSYLSRCELGQSNFPMGRLKRAIQLYKLDPHDIAEAVSEDYKAGMAKVLGLK